MELTAVISEYWDFLFCAFLNAPNYFQLSGITFVIEKKKKVIFKSQIIQNSRKECFLRHPRFTHGNNPSLEPLFEHLIFSQHDSLA